MGFDLFLDARFALMLWYWLSTMTDGGVTSANSARSLRTAQSCWVVLAWTRDGDQGSHNGPADLIVVAFLSKHKRMPREREQTESGR